MYKIIVIAIFFNIHLTAWGQTSEYSKQELYQFEGTYQFGNQHQLTLGIFDELNQKLVYLDLKTLKIGALIQISKNKFKEMGDSTQLFTFTKARNGISGLKMETKGLAQFGKKISQHTVSQVSFRSGKNLLKGDLYRPLHKNSKAAVVFAHGSGPSTRSVGFFTTFFLKLGISVLTFDKQGAGESGGDWETASLKDLATDVQAAIAFLKTQSNIDRSKIGIMGNSQGGWTGSMAAADTKDLAFLIMRVGAGESVFNTISHEYRGSLLADGFNQQEVEEMMQMYHTNWEAARKGQTWEEGNEMMLTYSAKPWFKKMFPEERKNTASASKWWTWLQKNLDYDSYPYLTQVKAPTLWLLAEKDWNVNSTVAYKRVSEALTVANNSDFRVSILPNMAHNGMVAQTGYYNEPLSFTYAPKFWDQLEDWLITRNLGIK